MQSAGTAVTSPATTSGYDGEWSKTALDGFEVCIAWNRLKGGAAISGVVRDRRGGEAQFFLLDLETAGIILALAHVDDAGRTTCIDVFLTLVLDGGLMSLKCRLPIAVDEFFYGAIGEWSLAPGPGPSSYPGPQTA